MFFKPLFILSLTLLGEAAARIRNGTVPRSSHSAEMGKTSTIHTPQSSSPISSRISTTIPEILSEKLVTTSTRESATSKYNTRPTSSASKNTTTSDQFDWRLLCNAKYHTAEIWRKSNMDQFIINFANNMPNNGQTALDHIKDKTPGLTDWECTIDMGCEPQTNGWECTEFAARIWFMIYAIRNVYQNYTIEEKAVQQGQINFGMTSDWLMDNFVTHDFQLAASTFKNSLMSGSMSMLTSLLGVIGIFGWTGTIVNVLKIVGVIAGVVGASATIDTGILGQMLQATVGVIQNEISVAGNAELYIEASTNAVINSLKLLSNNLVNTPVYNPPLAAEPYWKNMTGVFPYLLNGRFAELSTEQTVIKLNNDTSKWIYATAIAKMWCEQGVFFINVTGMVSPAGFPFSTLNSSDLIYEAFDGQEFIAAKYTAGLGADQDWDPVPGVAVLVQVGLTLVEFIQSMIYAQANYGFNHTYSDDEMIQILSDDDGYAMYRHYTAKKLLVTGVICNIGLLPNPVGFDSDSPSWNTASRFKKWVLSACPYQTATTANLVIQTWELF